jgi:hypothetical protein
MIDSGQLAGTANKYIFKNGFSVLAGNHVGFCRII